MSARAPDPSAAPALREALEASHYTAGGIRVALGGHVEGLPGDVAVADRRLGDDAQATLVRLLLLGLEVDADRAAAALAPADPAELESAGLLETVAEGRVRCPIRITPFEGILIAHDPDAVDEPEADIVTGLNSAARTLASLTPRRPARRALDVGTGCGLQAFLAAGHCEHVVATDVNPRALELTRLGAALSGLDNVEVREGSFFEPVEGEEFDLIVCNPPYVISPDTELVYRDGELDGDGVSRTAIQGAAAHLAEGGLAQVLCNWVHEPYGSWSEPLAGWIEGSGCDAVMLHHATEDQLEYAAKWNARLRGDPERQGEVLDRWIDSYVAAEIAAIGTGAVALRRREGGEPRTTTAEMTSGPAGEGGEQVLWMFAGQQTLAGLGPDALLETPLVVAGPHVLTRERTYEDGAYALETVRMTLADSAGVHAEFGPEAGALVAGIEAGHTPGQVAQLLAQATGADEHAARETVLGAVRVLLEQGFMLPAEGSDAPSSADL